MGDPLVYWILRWVVLITLALCGWLISYRPSKRMYWYYSLPAIVTYSLVEGLRWNRGVDYINYYHDLTGTAFKSYSDIFYTFWLWLFKMTGLPYWVAFIFYSLLLIISLLYLLRRFPKVAVWVLPLFFIITVRYSENMIRQYFSISFYLLGFGRFVDKKYISCIFLFIIGLLVHLGSIMFLASFAFAFFVSKHHPYKYPIIPVLIFIFFYFFWAVSYFDFIADLLSKIDLGKMSGMENYTYQAKRWFTEEGRLSYRNGTIYKGIGVTAYYVRFLLYLFVITYGYYVIKKQKNLSVIYWISFLAILTDVIKEDIEMYTRFFAWIALFIPFVIGNIYVKIKIEPIIKYISFILGFAYYIVYSVVNQMFIIDFVGYAFVWDK